MSRGSDVAKKSIGDPRDHYVELDALRGIAILGVVMSHIVGIAGMSIGAPLTIPRLGVDATNLLFFGTYGVTLFFLLSGYLLTWTEEKRARLGIYSIRSYALRRALRLVPAYYVAILIVVVLWPLNPPYPMEVSATDVLMHLPFLQGLAPWTVSNLDPIWWSLTPEVLFYCLLPFLVLKLRRVSQRLAVFGVFALITLGPRVYTYMAQTMPDPNSTPSLNFQYVLGTATSYMYIFLVGVLLRMLVEYLNNRPASKIRLRLATALFLISAVSMVVLPFFLEHPTIAALHGDPSWIVVGIPFDLIVIAFFASAVLGSPLLRRVLRWRFLAFTGVISYSMFLLHDTVLRMVAEPYFLPAIRQWVAGKGLLVVWAGFCGYTVAILAIAFIISYPSYRYVESPFLSYKPK